MLLFVCTFSFQERERELQARVARHTQEVADYKKTVELLSNEQRKNYDENRSLRQQLDTTSNA